MTALGSLQLIYRILDSSGGKLIGLPAVQNPVFFQHPHEQPAAELGQCSGLQNQLGASAGYNSLEGGGGGK